VIVTVRLAVSPGTRSEIEISDAAALLSLLAVSVAEPKELPGLVVVRGEARARFVRRHREADQHEG